ncbi:MAG: GTP-binding protein [Kiloniellales bacterium]
MTGPCAEDLDLPEAPIPVSVLTGFLGSGKTTVLNRLLAHPDTGETAVIVNEFGEIGLDHLLFESSGEDTVLLNSGCLCCTVRGDLIETMRRLFKRRARREVPAFQRLAVETTGLADPAPILHTLMTDPLLVNWFRLDGVIATVDAAAGAQTLDAHQESVKQAAVADRLLLTKTDLAEEAATERLRTRLRALNPAARILTVQHGAVEPAALFNAGLYDAETKSPDVRRWLRAEAYAEGHGHGHAQGHGHDVNRHDDRVRAFCLDYERPLDWDNFNAWIEMLITFYGADILRIKGLLDVEGQDRPMVIHGVQHIFHPPVLLEAWPDEDRRSRLVFITRGLDKAMFERTLKAFNEQGPGPLDPAAG